MTKSLQPAPLTPTNDLKPLRGKTLRRRLLVGVSIFLLGFVALLFLAPVALPLGPIDLSGTMRAERPGTHHPPQGFSVARTTGLAGGDVGQLTCRIRNQSVVLTWTTRASTKAQ